MLEEYRVISQLSTAHMSKILLLYDSKKVLISSISVNISTAKSTGNACCGDYAVDLCPRLLSPYCNCFLNALNFLRNCIAGEEIQQFERGQMKWNHHNLIEFNIWITMCADNVNFHP